MIYQAIDTGVDIFENLRWNFLVGSKLASLPLLSFSNYFSQTEIAELEDLCWNFLVSIAFCEVLTILGLKKCLISAFFDFV